MSKVYVGLDVGSSTFHVVALDPEGVILRDRSYPTHPANLCKALEKLGPEVHVHLEASSHAVWITNLLRPLVARVVVGHPKSNRWIANDPLKRDSLDARKLAELLRLNQLHPVFMPQDPRLQVLKQLVKQYDALTRQVVRAKSILQARLKEQGFLGCGDEVYTLPGLTRTLSPLQTPDIRDLLLNQRSFLDASIKAQKEALASMVRAAKQFPVFKILLEVPGCGQICAARFIGYIQDPKRFANRRQCWRFNGLGITRQSSDGKPLGRECLDRNANPKLKEISRIIFLASCKRRDNNRFRRSYQESLERTKDSTKARLSTQRKIVSTLMALWRSGEPYRDDHS